MSDIYSRHRRKKGKHPRWNHKNYHQSRRHRRKRRILRKSGWKLKYPELFELVETFPYIIKKTHQEITRNH